MLQYLELLKKVHVLGTYRKPAREGMPASKNLFGEMMEIDLRDGFPLLTTKKMAWNAIRVELLWFLRGIPNLRYLWRYNVHIWDQDAYRFYKRKCETYTRTPLSYDGWLERLWAMRNGSFWERNWDFDKMTYMGAVYPVQWRGTFVFGGSSHTDQILYMIENIRNNPTSRYHIVDAWNPIDIYLNKENSVLALPPCHMSHQILVDVENNEFDMLMYQRSADIFLGVPFNIASYALLCEFYSMMTGYKPRYLKMVFGSVDLYETHFEQARIQLNRDPKPLPRLKLLPNENGVMDRVIEFNMKAKEYYDNPTHSKLDEVINVLQPSDFELVGYDPYPAIKGKLDTGLGI